MAKNRRRPLRPYKYGVAGYAETLNLHPNTAISLHPKETNGRKSVARAHAKHVPSVHVVEPLKTPSLGGRFNALPSELRAHIFSFLLVQPVKWNLEHEQTCVLYLHPERDIRPRSWEDSVTRMRSCSSTPLYLWRIGTSCNGGWQGAATHPWRSKYAPDVQNPYLDSDEWDDVWRLKVTGMPFPKMNKDMPCLCARRKELNVLLVCRQWYEEASRVLWGSNVLAFESCELFADFATHCTARDKVTRISILNTGLRHMVNPNAPFVWPDWSFHKKRQALIAAVRELPALSHLELDACLLTDLRDVHSLLCLGMKGLKSVRFIHHEIPKPRSTATSVTVEKTTSHQIYPLLTQAILLRGGLPEEVARATKGEHRGWTKLRNVPIAKSFRRTCPKTRGPQKPSTSFLDIAVRRHVAFQEELKTFDVPPHRVVSCDDPEFWGVLWWKMQGGMGWSQSYLPAAEAHYEPAAWKVAVKDWRDVFPFADVKVDAVD